MIKYADRVFETSTTLGTGTINLAGAQTGYQSFVAGVGNGAKVPYAIFDGTNWEVGRGTVVSGSPDQLQRDVVLESSNAGSAVNWGAGTRNVILPLSSTFGMWRDENLNDTSSVGVGGGTANAQTVTMTPAPLGYSNGMIVRWIATVANTGAMTINVNGLGAKSYVDGFGTAFSGGEVVLGSLQQAFYNLATDKFVSLSLLAALGDNTVTNAKLAQVATARLKGRVTAGTGDVEDLTGTQATTLLDTFTSTLKGLAPASGGGTANFLRADGQWKNPTSQYISFNATTSGTFLDITGIPNDVVIIQLIFNIVSTNGTSGLIVQLGDSGGIETTGYSSCLETTTYTSGFNITPTTIAATNTRNGRVTLSAVGGTSWVCDSNLSDSTNATTANGSGTKTLSDALTTIRITTQGGANTFDGGSITVLYG